MLFENIDLPTPGIPTTPMNITDYLLNKATTS